MRCFVKTMVGEQWESDEATVDEGVVALTGNVAKTSPTIEDWSGSSVVMIPLHRVLLIWGSA